MLSDLVAFLSRHTAAVEEEAVWGDGTSPLALHITCYLGAEQPPLSYVTSARSLVFREESILVVRNRDSTHIFPGGRREGSETLEETLHREMLEETGWAITGVSMLGFMHFHHLSPKPVGHTYPHPDFIQVVYMATATAFIRDTRLADDYELEAAFRPITEAQTLELSPCQHLYLKEALRVR